MSDIEPLKVVARDPNAGFRTVASRLDRFIDAGYRPRIKTHIFRVPMDSAWADERDRMIEEGWRLMPDNIFMGWVVDAYAYDGTGQSIIGGTKRTLEEALAYAEQELDRRLEAREQAKGR